MGPEWDRNCSLSLGTLIMALKFTEKAGEFELRRGDYVKRRYLEDDGCILLSIARTFHIRSPSRVFYAGELPALNNMKNAEWTSNYLYMTGRQSLKLELLILIFSNFKTF
ncbi:hypothetical protein OCU04_010588 [Sclerotinia nivalis]|uniref:Uncharacterized protein n=1 Tax=Sclerotinia nivalis TaxID=352851 RepID=A0A9X0DEW0_9HELO|nr:hypothetical protein OCU04_010588 [Sclerotinia nivalis]